MILMLVHLDLEQSFHRSFAYMKRLLHISVMCLQKQIGTMKVHRSGKSHGNAESHCPCVMQIL